MREPLNTTLHPVLAELPEFAPDAGLWSRIVATQAKTSSASARRARPRWPFATAAAAAIAIVAVAVGPRIDRAPRLSEGQRESETLEREWQALAPTAIHASANVARLHVIDAALQSAYDRGARTDELQPLWKARNDALRGLILTAGSESVTRI
jgi:hypothetical protein